MKKLLCALGLLAIGTLLHDPATHHTPVEQPSAEPQAAVLSAIQACPTMAERKNVDDCQNESPFTKLEAETGPAIATKTAEVADADDSAEEHVPRLYDPISSERVEKAPVPPAQSGGSGLPGFDHVPYLGPNICIVLEDMYENGNKIGIMGDINKQVGIMG